MGDWHFPATARLPRWPGLGMTRLSRATKSASNGLATLGGAVVTALQLIPTTKEMINKSLPGYQGLIAVSGFLILTIGGYQFVRSLVRGAYVATYRNQMTPLTVLAGRATVLDHIVKQCRAYRQVFLEASPGGGTTAVLSCGLIEKFKGDSQLRAIYVESLARTGERDEETLLSEAFARALSQEERGALGITPEPQPAQVWDTLRNAATLLGNTPLLVIDHFDDYVRTCPPQCSTDLASAATNSPFWTRIQDLLRQKRVRVLIAGVSSAFRNCEAAFSFVVASEVITLGNLDRAAASMILDRVFLPSSAEKPDVDDDWQTIKERIMSDLAPRSTVPARHLALAIHGLLELDELSEQAYAECGRLDGLCAIWLRKLAAALSQARGWSDVEVLVAMSALTQSEGLRREPLSARAAAKVVANMFTKPEWNHLARACRLSGDAKLTDIYQAVRQAGIEHADRAIAVTLEPGTQEPLYQLRYDFLARSAYVALAEYDAIAIAVARRVELHRSGRGLAWWSTLLPPGLQVRAAVARAFGAIRGPSRGGESTPAFRYGANRAFAVVSLVRLLPYALPVAGYVLLADAGTSLPLAPLIRAELDHTGVAILRRAESVSQITAEATTAREAILDIFRRRLHPGPWIKCFDNQKNLDKQPWLMGQAVAAALSVPQLTSSDEELFWGALQTVMESGFLAASKDTCIGFRNGQLSDRPFVEPTIWTALAIAEAFGHKDLFAKHQEELRHWSARLRSCLASYVRRGDDVYVTEFPRQDADFPASVYATALALLLDSVEVEVAGEKELTAEADGLRRGLWTQGVVEKGHGRASNVLRGWHALAETGTQVDDAVTWQVAYSILASESINAHRDDADEVSKLASLDALIADLLNIYEDVKTPLVATTAVFAAPFTDQDDKYVTNEHVVRFLWYPWALGTASKWQSTRATVGSRYSRLVAQRASSRFLSLKNIVVTETNATFQMSEFLFSLQAVLNGWTE